MVPEVILRVTEKFDERDQGSPRMRTVNQEALQEDLSHDLPEPVNLDLLEKVQHKGAEPVRVSIRIAEMQHHGAQEMMLTYEVVRKSAIKT